MSLFSKSEGIWKGRWRMTTKERLAGIHTNSDRKKHKTNKPQEESKYAIKLKTKLAKKTTDHTDHTDHGVLAAGSL